MGPPRRKLVPPDPTIPAPTAYQEHNIPYSDIYATNLKVIQRRVPDVVAYLDTFSHVCVFRKESKSWVKGGEGPFFLVERLSYPPYAFYVMNRNHNGDLLLPVYPEDEANPMDGRPDMAVYQSFPEFTRDRLAALPPDLDRFSKEYLIETVPAGEKGMSLILGLWWKPTGLRDSLEEVLTRVIECTRRGEEYPMEYRCSPEKPPELRDMLDDAPRQTESLPREPRKKSASKKAQKQGKLSDSSLAAGGESQNALSAPNPNTNATNPVDALFAGLNPSSSSPPTALESQSKPTSPPRTGIPLLDSIFASASSTPPPAPRATVPLTVSDYNSDSIQSCSSSEFGDFIPFNGHVLTSGVLQGLINGSIPLHTTLTPSPDASPTSSTMSSHHRRVSSTDNSQEADDEYASFNGASSISEITTVLDSAPSSDLDDISPGVNPRTPRVNGDSRSLHPNRSLSQPAPMERSGIPFSDESQLWPYPQRCSTDTSVPDQNEIPEFDFSDTRDLNSLTSGVTPSIVYGSGINGYSSSHFRGNVGDAYQSSINGSQDNIGRHRGGYSESPMHLGIDGVHAPPSSHSSGSQVLGTQPEGSAAVTPRAEPASLDPERARQAILDALNGQLGKGITPSHSPRMPKNDFVRELLTFIHTDRAFVDSLWNSYYAPL